MMNRKHVRSWKLATTALIALLLATPAASGSHQGRTHSSSPGDPEMRNYGVIWEHKLTRSGMPHSDAGWNWLQQQGVKSIVTFRENGKVDYAVYGFNKV